MRRANVVHVKMPAVSQLVSRLPDRAGTYSERLHGPRTEEYQVVAEPQSKGSCLLASSKGARGGAGALV
jgi:hypothetical protein